MLKLKENGLEGSPNPATPPPVGSYYRKWWIDNRERIAEWYRRYFHTIAVTVFFIFDLFLFNSGIIIYLSHWSHKIGSPEVFLSFFIRYPPRWLVSLYNLFYVPIDTYHPFWMFILFELPILNWLYSTVSQPIKKGYDTIISWTSEKGRIWAAIISTLTAFSLFCALNAWYVDTYQFKFFASVKVDKHYLVVNSMESFGYILMLFPVALCLFGVYWGVKQFTMYEDLQKQFFAWEFPLLARQSFSLKNNKCDVVIGWDKKTKKPIVVSENSRYLHEVIDGTTGSGKTSTSILIRVVQDLIRIARGRKMGIVVLEPKGDCVRDILKLCKELGIPDEKIKVVDPTNLARSVKFNPYMGALEDAAENFRGVLDSLTGDQDDFFKGQQNETAASYTMLGKLRFGSSFNITHMQRMYTDPRYLADITEEVRQEIDSKYNDPNISTGQKRMLDRYDRICKYFEDEILEYKTYKGKDGEVTPALYGDSHRYAGRQVVENKKDKFVAGAKKYLNDLVLNAMLTDLMVANDDQEVLDIDNFLEEGGVLLVNSALGQLNELSLMFGQFFIRQFQSSVFKRPPEENGYKRIPIFFYVDEFPLFANESFERMLTLGRSYRVGSLIAIQSIGQLAMVMKDYERVIIGNARNRTVFGGGVYEDNEYFSKQFGEDYQIEESLNESTTPVTMPNQSWGYRYNTQRSLVARFSPTDIMELPFKHFVCQLVSEDGSMQPPIKAFGRFVNETKLIDKFVDVGKIELETKKHKSIGINEHLNYYRGLVASAVQTRKEATEEEPKLQNQDEKQAAPLAEKSKLGSLSYTDSDQIDSKYEQQEQTGKEKANSDQIELGASLNITLETKSDPPVGEEKAENTPADQQEHTPSCPSTPDEESKGQQVDLESNDETIEGTDEKSDSDSVGSEAIAGIDPNSILLFALQSEHATDPIKQPEQTDQRMEESNPEQSQTQTHSYPSPESNENIDQLFKAIENDDSIVNPNSHAMENHDLEGNGDGWGIDDFNGLKLGRQSETSVEFTEGQASPEQREEAKLASTPTPQQQPIKQADVKKRIINDF